MIVSELTDCAGDANLCSIASYADPPDDPGTQKYLLGLMDSDAGYSLLYIQNLSTSADTVEVAFLDATGATVYTQYISVPAGGIAQIDLSSISGLPENFTGSALVTSTEDVLTWVDIFP